jgi:PAS domain S-box-containing protein
MSIQYKFLTVILGIVFIPAVIVNVAVFHGVAESMRGIVFGLWAAASLFLVIAAWVMARRMARPILDMSEIATRVAQDNLEGGALRMRSPQVDYSSRDEIGSLTQSFNAMIRNLQEQRAKLVERAYVDSILESMTDALIVTGAGGTIKMANQAAWDLLGYDGNELLGQNAGRVIRDKATLGDFFIGEDFKAFLREGSVRQLDLVYVTKGGEQIPVSFSGSVIYKKDGRLASSIHREAAAVENSDRSVGIVGVARDMRMTESLIADMEKSRRKTEEWSHTLERRVEERTRDLSREQEAMLNILEDLAASKGELEESNRAIRNVKEEIEAFSRTLEEKVKERTFELSVLYEISNAISYTLDYQTLLKLIMEAIYRVVPYDICVSLLLDARAVNITAKLSHQENASLIEGVKDKLIGASSMLTGQDLSNRQVYEDVIQPVVSMAEPSPAGGEGIVENPDRSVGKERPCDKIRSFFNIPFIVHGRILGMINISSCEDAIFNESNVRLIYTIVNQAATAIERLRSVIRAEKSKMERMVASMAEGVIMVDERGEVIVLNLKARQMLGFLPDEEISGTAINRKMRMIGFDKAIEECRTGKEAVTRETVIPQQDGGLYVHSDISPVKDAGGKIIGIVAILIDVTREKQVEKLKDEFVSTVSHELRTPLAITTEGINLILDGIAGPVNEMQRELLGTSRDNLSRLNTIINDLLDISKIEAGKVTLRYGLMDFRALLVHLGDVYQKTLATKKQTIALKLPESPCLIYADRDKIIQIIANLLNNAHKFTPEGSRIEMGLSVRPGDVLCGVKDNGVGIAAEDLPKVFNKFEQFGRTYGPGIKGTGLGLSIVKSLVEIHGGKIWVESQAGQGTAFFFTIPTYETVRSRFNAEAGHILEEADTQKQCVSFMVVHLKNSDVIKSRYGERMLIDIVTHLCDITSKIISRTSDRFVLYDTCTIYAVLPWTNRSGALAIMKRFKSALEECVLPIEDKGDLEVQFGLATYPFDARSPEGLVQAALHNMARKKRVLVVDDNPDILRLLQVDFKNDAVEFEAAGDGQDALLKVQENAPDLIVLDIMLPKMNGYEVLGRLKHDARTASIPVVVLTAKEKGEVEREFGGLGDIPVISKTGGFEKLEQIVKELL